jgi:Zn-dependent protease with chaperone function
VAGESLFSPEEVERSRRYHRPLYAASLLALALDLAVLALLAFGSPGRRLFALLAGLPWWVQAPGDGALVVCAGVALRLPLSVWAGYVREHRYGFSTQGWRGYAADRAKGLALEALLVGLAVAGLVASARALPQAWPLLAAGAGALLVLALALLAPLLIEPLFSRFSPIGDGELATALAALADRAELPIREVLVADASRRTRKANAYVSGLGATRRLVLYDTLLARATRAEVELVLAHELGHRRARHILKGTLLGMAGLGLFVTVLWALLRDRWLRGALGAPAGAADPRVAAFVLLAAALAQLLAAPAGAGLSRRFEREADRFSLELTGDLDAFEATHRLLAEANLSDLDPPRALYLAFFSHPTPGERIAAARRLVARG